MTPALIGVLPDDFTNWRMETIRLPNRTACVARRAGVTIHLIEDDGWWTVTKMHKGQVLVRKTVKQLPSEVRRSILAARR